MHPAGLADTQLLAVDCVDQVTAGFKHALRVACPLVEPGPAATWQGQADRRSAVIVSHIVTVSPPQTMTWVIPLDSIVIRERLATTLSGVYMPFRRSPS
jgi:hypothetical protein